MCKLTNLYTKQSMKLKMYQCYFSVTLCEHQEKVVWGLVVKNMLRLSNDKMIQA